MAAKTDFFFGFGVGNNAAAVDFAAGACSGGNGHDGERSNFNALAPAGPLRHIVPEVAGVGRHHGHGLAAVHDGTAAERDNKVALGFTGGKRGFHDVVDNGIGLHHRAVHILSACALERFHGALEGTGAFSGFPARREQKRLLAGKLFVTQGVKPAGAENKTSGRLECELHMKGLQWNRF